MIRKAAIMLFIFILFIGSIALAEGMQSGSPAMLGGRPIPAITLLPSNAAPAENATPQPTLQPGQAADAAATLAPTSSGKHGNATVIIIVSAVAIAVIVALVLIHRMRPKARKQR
jgi:hypothetical protein